MKISFFISEKKTLTINIDKNRVSFYYEYKEWHLNAKGGQSEVFKII